jgi:hypothetical protein
MLLSRRNVADFSFGQYTRKHQLAFVMFFFRLNSTKMLLSCDVSSVVSAYSTVYAREKTE